MIVDISSWMLSWGWCQLVDMTWEKRSPSGLIIAQQGDATWEADCQRAVSYENQLIGTRAN